MKSIRLYLVLMIISVICISNFSAALHGYTQSLKSADKLVENQLLEKARILAMLTSHQSKIPVALFDNNTFYQIWWEQKLVAHSTNAPTDLLATVDGQFHLISYQGIRWRSIGLVHKEQPITVVVAQRFDYFSQLAEDILIEAIVPIIWILPVLGILVFLVIHIGLKPLKKLANNLADKEVNDLSLINAADYTGEMAPIVNSLNQLLQRLSHAFERERRFSADAAHELRTPLAALKIELHNVTQTLKADQELMQLNAIVDRMGHSIEQLLTLQRLAVSSESPELQRCDLTKIAQQVIAEIYPQIMHKQQSLSLSADTHYVEGDPFALAILIRNLVDNASKYTPKGGEIRVSIHERDAIYLNIEDSGPGIPESEYGRITDRFYRVGGDQHQSGIVGSGLGLSIVLFISQLHYSDLQFSQASLGGLAVDVIFPKHIEEVPHA